MAQKTENAGGKGPSPPRAKGSPLAAQRAARKLTEEQQMRINQRLIDAVGKGDVRRAKDAVEGGADEAAIAAALQLARKKYAKCEQDLASAQDKQQGAARKMPAFTMVETPGYGVGETERDTGPLMKRLDVLRKMLDFLGGKGQ